MGEGVARWENEAQQQQKQGRGEMLHQKKAKTTG